MRMTHRVRTAMIVVGGMLLLCISIVFTFSLVAPAAALSVWPSARGLGAAAFKASTVRLSASAADIARSNAMAALRTEPGNIAAVKAMATLADAKGDRATAARWFQYGEKLTRRDLISNLWLIEHAVADGNISAALGYYDAALRTSPDAPAILYPVLIEAAADPAIRTPLARLLATRPPWYRGFASALITRSSRPTLTIPDLIGVLRLDMATPVEKELLVGALTKLAGASANTDVARLYGATLKVRTAGLVHNPSFSRFEQLPPLDWTFTDQPEVGVMIEPGGNGKGHALSWSSDAEWQGDVASQLILAPPGRYVLRARVGNYTPSRNDDLRIRITCAQPGKARIVVGELPIPAVGDAGSTVTGEIVIPPRDCAAQNLILAVRNDSQPSGRMPWITDLDLSPFKNGNAKI